MAYLDDIIIHSAGRGTHLGRLEAMLGVLWEARLTANVTKCHLSLEENAYLGYTLGRGCMRPQTTKVDSIATWPWPTSTRQVRAFWGLVWYYRQFIPAFASLAAHLHHLTSKGLPNAIMECQTAEALPLHEPNIRVRRNPQEDPDTTTFTPPSLTRSDGTERSVAP